MVVIFGRIWYAILIKELATVGKQYVFERQ